MADEFAQVVRAAVVQMGMREKRWTADKDFHDGTVWDLHVGDEHIGWVIRPVSRRAGSSYPCIATRLRPPAQVDDSGQDFANLREAARWLESQP